jgi:heme a synthase
MSRESSLPSSYSRFAWFTLVYCVGVILWGAFVRATGSGAGCGDHWPLCNGQVVPRPEHVKTLIEFTHRLTSGLSLVFVGMLFVFTRKLFPSGSFQRKAAGTSLLAIVVEALIGAKIVLLRLVEYDQSMTRVFSISLHLVNTLFLVGALTITAMAASEAAPRWRWPEPGKSRRWARGILGGFCLIGALGAMTALGDTLFPVTSLTEEIRSKFDGQRHFLEQIRLLHPLLAVLWAGALWVWLADLGDRFPFLRPRTRLLLWLTGGNMLFGLANVLLLAPVWMQIVHLLWANILWILLVSLAFSAASRWR